MQLHYNLFCFLLGFQSILLAATAHQFCKPQPKSPDWPSAVRWQELNASTAGNLRAPIPAGLVCQPTQPTFNNASCATLVEQWPNSSWHSSSPWSTDYNDDTCLPDPSAPCSAAGYPAYVVEAKSTSHVQAAVKFALKTGVRLNIKGTGHDYPGRSSGPESLSIWTHQLRGIEVTLGNARAVKHGASAAVKIFAGMRWGEIYAAVAQYNLTIVGGGDLDVGIGGWTMGGGHSPLSSRYGLGADQVLEMEVVTADGEYRVINEAAYPDLFWAMRGGGPSTNAVLLSVTMKAYPQLPGVIYQFSYNTTAGSDTFWSLVAGFHTHLVGLSEAGAMGYYYVFPPLEDSSLHTNLTTSSSTLVGTLTGGFIFPECTEEQVKAIMTPVEVALQSPPEATDPIVKSASTLSFPDFTKLWLMNAPETVGSDGRLGSWLLDGPALAPGNYRALKMQLQKSTPAGEFFIGHLVAGPGVRNARIPGGSNAVLPAWRKSYVHAGM
jgi:hypothetical protein